MLFTLTIENRDGFGERLVCCGDRETIWHIWWMFKEKYEKTKYPNLDKDDQLNYNIYYKIVNNYGYICNPIDINLAPFRPEEIMSGNYPHSWPTT